MDEKEQRDQTEDLEEEELSGAVEDTDEDEEDKGDVGPGEALYDDLLEDKLVIGAWENLTPEIQRKWNQVVADFCD